MTSVDEQVPEPALPKPAPQPTPESAALWSGAARHQLVIQRCMQCRHLLYPPDIACPQCHSEDLIDDQLTGRGRLYSFTVITRPFHQGFAADVPYVVGFVELSEQAGLRLITTIVGFDRVEDLVVDMPVEAVYDDRDGHTVVLFRPRTEDVS